MQLLDVLFPEGGAFVVRVVICVVLFLYIAFLGWQSRKWNRN